MLNSKWQRNKQYMDFLKNVEITKGRKLETLLGDSEFAHSSANNVVEMLFSLRGIGAVDCVVAPGGARDG